VEQAVQVELEMLEIQEMLEIRVPVEDTETVELVAEEHHRVLVVPEDLVDLREDLPEGLGMDQRRWQHLDLQEDLAEQDREVLVAPADLVDETQHNLQPLVEVVEVVEVLEHQVPLEVQELQDQQEIQFQEMQEQQQIQVLQPLLL
jgi:hypothetical protein